jgi:nicotinic acid mononucleotide adenylyltransferase
MARQNIRVPYGYEPTEESRKGTLIFYDSFEDITDAELERAFTAFEQRAFAKLVLYPLHEDTVRRMWKEPVSPFHKRQKRLEEWKLDFGHSMVSIQNWDGKRKKYTPIDTALRYLSETYPSPYFLYMTPDMANLFASFSTFEEWIVQLRLLLSAEPETAHPRLEKFRHRWDVFSG